jgi:hypothetical protein
MFSIDELALAGKFAGGLKSLSSFFGCSKVFGIG